MKLSFIQCRALFFLLVSILGYIFTPRQQEFSLILYYITVFVALTSLILFLKSRCKRNYFDFDTIFLSVCYIIGFFASFFYKQPFYRALFFFEFNYSYLNSGAWLFTIGMNAYFCGSLFVKPGIESFANRQRIYPTLILFCIDIVLMLVFIFSGGITYYQQIYGTSEGTSSGYVTYILLLLTIVSVLLIVLEIRNKFIDNRYIIHKKYFVVIVLFSLLLLYVGNRTTASMLLLPILGLYAFWFKPITLKLFVVFLLLAILSMWIVQKNRANEEVGLNSASPALLLIDMTIPSRTIYESMDYVDNYGYTYGKSMALGILGLIPGLAGVVTNGSPDYGSAELLSQYTFYKQEVPDEYQIGLGTTIISDLYLSFGIIGVIALMWMLGKVVHTIELRSRFGNLFASYILGIFLANSVFWARGSYTHPIRFVLWGMLLLFIYKSAIYTFNKYNRNAETL